MVAQTHDSIAAVYHTNVMFIFVDYDNYNDNVSCTVTHTYFYS